MGWYNEVFDLVFGDVQTEKANSLWTEQLKEKKGDKEKEKDESTDGFFFDSGLYR